mgnify:FL=1
MGADIQSGQRKVGREVINPKRRVELRRRPEKNDEATYCLGVSKGKIGPPIDTIHVNELLSFGPRKDRRRWIAG